MVFKDIKLASYMAADNIFGGIILPSFLLSLLSIPVFLFVIPILQTPAIGIPIVLLTACFMSAIFAAVYAQIPLQGKVKRPVINAFYVAFCHPINALLYPFYSIFAMLLLFPITLAFMGASYLLEDGLRMSGDMSTVAILFMLGQIVVSATFTGGVSAASLAMWAFFQLPKAEGRMVSFSTTNLIILAIGAGIRGAIASLIIFPVLAIFIIELTFIIISMDNGGPNLLLLIATFFTSLITAAAVAIPFLSGIAFLRRAFMNEDYPDMEDDQEATISNSFSDQEDGDPTDYTIWKD